MTAFIDDQLPGQGLAPAAKSRITASSLGTDTAAFPFEQGRPFLADHDANLVDPALIVSGRRNVANRRLEAEIHSLVLNAQWGTIWPGD